MFNRSAHIEAAAPNPACVICRFQPAALLSGRLMDFKRQKNDDHPHKWACQIQDRVLEPHFKQGDYLFHSSGGNMNICRRVNRTAVSSCNAGKRTRRKLLFDWCFYKPRSGRCGK